MLTYGLGTTAPATASVDVVAPALTLRSGDRATIETLTHHAGDDFAKLKAARLAANA